MILLSIIGNLGGVPNVRTTAEGREFMSFSVAVTNRDKSTTWVSVSANMQSSLLPYMTKGRQVYVRGDMRVEMYKNEPSINVHAERIELCGGKDKEQDTEPAPVENDTTY